MKKSQFKKRRSSPCRVLRCTKPSSPIRPQKSNITAERVTVLPGFLSNDIKLKSSKSPNSSVDEFVEEPKLRRSWRLCKKNDPVTVSGYYNKLVSENQSKSIFKEIKKKAGVKKEEKNCDDFEERFLNDLNEVELRDFSYYRESIKVEIEKINLLLSGNRVKGMSGNRKRNYIDNDKENYSLKFPHFPPSSWVFQTPPNKKTTPFKVEESQLKPAVIETRKEKKILYEMKESFEGLQSFSNREEINIDKRFMLELDNDESDEKMGSLQCNPFELESHFSSLTCRPKKNLSSLRRHQSLKRKRDIFEPQPGCSKDSDDLNLNNECLSPLNTLEESFTFEITSTNSLGSPIAANLFDFKNKNNCFNFNF